ncbi:hypothetical protein FRC17_007818, partial [Serendipita sp. 399]
MGTRHRALSLGGVPHWATPGDIRRMAERVGVKGITDARIESKNGIQTGNAYLELETGYFAREATRLLSGSQISGIPITVTGYEHALNPKYHKGRRFDPSQPLLEAKAPATTLVYGFPQKFALREVREFLHDYRLSLFGTPEEAYQNVFSRITFYLTQDLQKRVDMAPVFSKPDLKPYTAAYIRHRPTIQRILNLGFVAWTLGGTYWALQAKSGEAGQGRSASRRSKKGETSTAGGASKPKRVQIDALFYQRLRTLLRIVIPGIRSREAMLLIMHSSLLVFRTAISIYVAKLDGRVVGSLVRAQPVPFLLNILRWLLVAVPATWCNSWLSYVQSKLALAYRSRLTEKAMELYLGEVGSQDKIYYKL